MIESHWRIRPTSAQLNLGAATLYGISTTASVGTGQAALPVNMSKLSMLPLSSFVQMQLALSGSTVMAYVSSCT